MAEFYYIWSVEVFLKFVEKDTPPSYIGVYTAGPLDSHEAYREKTEPVGITGCGSWLPGMRLLLVGLLIAVSTLWCGLEDALAHKVGMYGWTEGEFLIVEGYFGGGTKTVNCPVTLQDSSGKTLAVGKTDEKGIAKFKIADLPKFNGDVKAILDAGEGHRAEYTIQASEFQERSNIAEASNPSAKPEQPPGRTPVQASDASTGSQAAAKHSQSSEALRQAVAMELEPVVHKLGTLERLLRKEQDRGPSVKDIVGGIGWIMGLVGLWVVLCPGLTSVPRSNSNLRTVR